MVGGTRVLCTFFFPKVNEYLCYIAFIMFEPGPGKHLPLCCVYFIFLSLCKARMFLSAKTLHLGIARELTCKLELFPDVLTSGSS